MTTFYVKLSKSTDPANFRRIVENLGANAKEIYSPFPGRHPDRLQLKASDPSSATKLEAFLAKATSVETRTVDHAIKDFMVYLQETEAPRYGVSRTQRAYTLA